MRNAPSHTTVLLLLLSAVSPAGAQTDTLADHFGFDGLEVIKVDQAAGPFSVVDLNGDGLQDLIAVNNRNSRLDVHYQKLGALPTDAVPAPRRPNELPEHWRYRKSEIPVSVQVGAVVPYDFDGDGILDLILGSSSPGRIVFLRQKAPGEWEVARNHTVKNLLATRDSLAIQDVIGDSKPELIGLAGGRVQVWPLDGTNLGAPTELSAGTANLVAMLHEDFDGDGTQDIGAVVPDDAAPIRVWFGANAGDGKSLGSQHRFEMPPLREASSTRLPSEKGAALVVIERPSKRLVISRFVNEQVTQATGGEGSLQTWSFDDPSNRKRDTTIADINGDKLPDLLATNTESNSVVAYTQSVGRGFTAGKSFPAYSDLDFIAARDIDGDGKSEVFLSSEKEGAVGRTKSDGGSLPFPTTVPLAGGSVPTALGLVQVDGRVWAAIVAKDNRTYTLELVPTGDGEKVSIPLGSLSRSPDTVLDVDADQDGLVDLLLFTPDKPMTMLRQEPKVEGKPPAFKLLESKDMGQFGLAQAANAANTAVADIDGDGKAELLVADKNFIRALRYTSASGWQVVNQINAPRGDTKLVSISLMGDKLIAGDRENGKLLVFAKGTDGVWSQTESIDAGGFKFNSIAAGHFSGDSTDAVLMVGDDSFGVLTLGGSRIKLEEIGSYRSDVPARVSHEVTTGDLNGDGLIEVIALDAGEQMCEVLTVSETNRLLYALGFEVFESKMFSGGEPRQFEPSQGEVADVTGDGANDLLLLCHDRILLYPQATARGVAKKAAGN